MPALVGKRAAKTTVRDPIMLGLIRKGAADLNLELAIRGKTSPAEDSGG